MDVKPLYAWAAVLAIMAQPALAETARLKSFFDAALYGSVQHVRQLPAEDKSLVAARDPNGFTVLHIVATEDRPEVQRLLLESGANPNAVNRDGALHPLTGTDPR
jgi:ankyrin repeat protein